ncbi:MAG: hypothetical protein R3F60_12880 [bacterium]
MPRLAAGALAGRARAEGATLVGVVGYSRPLDPASIPAVDAALQAALEACAAAAGGPIYVVSGATDAGVPGRAHALARRLGLVSVGFTARAALAWPLAPLDLLVLAGQRFGDESAAFVRTCDAFVVLGGGPQSTHEIAAARAAGKPVTAIQGLGGAADALAEGPGVTLRALRASR